MFGGKLDVGRREDLFLVLTRCLGENWTSEGVKTFFLRNKRGPRNMISEGVRIA